MSVARHQNYPEWIGHKGAQQLSKYGIEDWEVSEAPRWDAGEIGNFKAELADRILKLGVHAAPVAIAALYQVDFENDYSYKTRQEVSEELLGLDDLELKTAITFIEDGVSVNEAIRIAKAI